MQLVADKPTIREAPLPRLAHTLWRCISVAALVVILGLVGLVVASRAGGYKLLIVRSGSMTGTADIGSVVISRPLEAGAVKPGDVILMQLREDGVVHPPVLHRVIERSIDESGEVVVRTKGDANEFADPNPYVLRGTTVTPVLVIPQIGFAVSVLQKPAGWFGLVILPTLLFAAVFLCRLWSSEEEES